MTPTLRSVRRITVHCPIRPETLAAVATGAVDALAADPGIAPLLALIESSTEFGDFGHYKGVCEIGLGLEAFTPQAGASPTLGTAGRRSMSPTATLTTYVATEIDGARLAALVGVLAARHPWEIPVIEVADVRLAERGAQASV
jgi:hypothetical protein